MTTQPIQSIEITDVETCQLVAELATITGASVHSTISRQ